MGSRYLLTGADIGILIATGTNDKVDFKEYVDEILEKRYVTNINSDILEDIKKVKIILEEEEKCST